MKKLLLLSGMIGLLLASPVYCQKAIYVGGGPSVDAAFNVTTGLCNEDSSTCALINYAGHGSVRDLKSMTYTTTAGVRRVLANANLDGAKVDLFVLASGGAAVSGDGPTPAVDGGGGLTYHPKKWPNWGVTFAAVGSYTKAGGSGKNLFFQVGYTFHTDK